MDMKIFKIAFIILASSTYRCSDQEVVNCKNIDKEILGEWSGSLNYSGPRSAIGDNHTFILKIDNSNNCSFSGSTSYDNFITTFNISGFVDPFGWISFTEVSIKNDGGEYSDCLLKTNSTLICNEWPALRWRKGNKFQDAKLNRNPFSFIGRFERPNSFEKKENILIGNFNLSKN